MPKTQTFQTHTEVVVNEDESMTIGVFENTILAGAITVDTLDIAEDLARTLLLEVQKGRD